MEKDIAKALGYSNPRDAISKHVDLEDKDTVAFHDGTSGNPNKVIINESGLYSLILSSKLSTARDFKHWVTSEVLPSIRKHGAYMTDLTIEKLVDNPDLLIDLATKLKESRKKVKKLEIENVQKERVIAEMQPKVSYYDIVLQTPDVVPITIIAKDYGKSAKWLNKLLNHYRVQYKQSGVWILYKEYAEQGYTKSKTETYVDRSGFQHSKMHTYWTQKGRLFIYDLLKHKGILPLIEQ